MTKMTYREQLLHPNWQRKRLEVLQRADFRCETCSDTETTLHVHHKRYVKGRMAWEYDLGELVALCENCHEYEHETDPLRLELLARLGRDGPWGIGDFMAYGAGGVSGWVSRTEDPRLFELMQQWEQASPLLFTCGAIAAALSNVMSMNGALRLAYALSSEGEEELREDFMDVLKAHDLHGKGGASLEESGE